MTRIVFRIVAVLVLIVVSPVVALQFPPLQDYVLRRVLREVNARIPGVVLAGAVEGNMLSEIRLRDVRIEHKNRLVGSADAVAVRWNPLALLRGKIVADRVMLEGAFVHLWKDGERWSIVAAFTGPPTAPSAPARPEGGKPLELAVGEVVGDDLGLLISHADGGSARYRVSHMAGAVAVRAQAVVVDLRALAGDSSQPMAVIRDAHGHVRIPLAAPYRWQVNRFELALRESRVRLDGDVTLMPGGAVSLTLETSPAAPPDAQPLGSPVRIPLWLRAGVNGQWDALRWQADATSPAGRVHLAGQAALPVTAPYAPAFSSAWVEAEGELDGLAPAAWFGLPQAAGTHLRAAVRAGARRDAQGGLQAHASLDGAGSTLGGRRVSKLQVTAAYRLRRLEASLALVAAEGGLQGSGVVDVARKTYDVRVRARHLQPAAFLGPAFGGDVNFTASLAGEGFAPETVRARGRLDVEHSRVAGYALERLRLPVALAGGRATISDGELRSPLLDVRLTGKMPLVAGRPANLRLLARTENLGALIPATDATTAFTGRAMAHLQVHGELHALSLRGSVQAAEVAGRGAALPKVAVTFEAQRVDPFARTGALELLAVLTAPSFAPYDAEAATFAVSLARDREGEATGTFYADILESGKSNELRGRYALPREGFEVHLESVAVYLADHRWTNHGEADIGVHGGQVRIDKLDLRAGEQQIFADGSIDPAGAQNLRLLVNRVDLRMLAALSGRSERIAGEFNGSAWVSGTFDAPKFTAAVAVTDLVVREYKVQMLTGFFSYEARRLDAEVRVVQSRKGGMLRADLQIPLDLSASLPAGASRLYDGPLRGEITAERISLAIVAAVRPEVADVSGRVDMHVLLRGTPALPRLAGDLSVSDGRFRVVPSGVQYERLTMTARFREQTVVVEELRVATGGRGSLTAKGDLDLPLGNRDGRLAVRAIAANFKVIDNRLAEGRIDGELNLTGSFEAPLVQGRIETDGVIIKPPSGNEKQLEPLTFEHTGVHVVGEETEAEEALARERQVRAPLLKRASVDVALVIERNAWVRNDDMNIELRGRLRALKDPGEEALRVSGEITTVRGFYRLRSRQLDIEEGRVMFTGTEALNPLIDVTLRYDVPDYQISAHVTGTTQKPNLTLSSTPPLEQGDIVAVLVFGRPLDRLGAGEKAEMRDRVGQLLGGLAAEQLRKRLGPKLGLDTLVVTPAGAEKGAEVGVGKYVSEDVFVEYVQRFGLEAASEIRLDYYFTRRWLVQTSTSTTGESGADVFWNVTF